MISGPSSANRCRTMVSWSFSIRSSRRLTFLTMLVMITHLMDAGAEDSDMVEDTSREEGVGPHIMLWVENDDCQYETVECRRNDGPHPLISFYTSAMDSSMEVNIFLNGKLLQRTTDQTSTMSMIMRSPHEFAERESRGDFVHSLMGCIVDRYGKIVAKDEMEFSYDLTNKLLQDVKSFRPPCPVVNDSDVFFNYRGGDGHGTHQPVLHAAFFLTSGSVVEFGMGFYSTPMLHHLCAQKGRRLTSLDTDKEWVSKFEHFKSETHRIHHVAGWDEVEGGEIMREILSGSWGLAFVDQHPESARIEVARRIKNRTKFIVMHDAYRQLGQKGFEKFSDEFKRFHEFFPPRPFPVLAGPPTLLASQEEDCDIDIDFYSYDQWCYPDMFQHNRLRGLTYFQESTCQAQNIDKHDANSDAELIKIASLLTNQYQLDPVYMSSPLISFFPVLEATISQTSGCILLLGALRETQEAAQEVVARSIGGKDRRIVPVLLEDGTSGRGRWWQENKEEELLGADQLRSFFPALAPMDLSRDLRKALSSLASQRDPVSVVLVDELGFKDRATLVRVLLEPPASALSFSFQWLVLHDIDRLVKGDLLRLPASMHGHCFQEFHPPRPWPSLTGPTTLLVSGDRRCSMGGGDQT